MSVTQHSHTVESSEDIIVVYPDRDENETLDDVRDFIQGEKSYYSDKGYGINEDIESFVKLLENESSDPELLISEVNENTSSIDKLGLMYIANKLLEGSHHRAIILFNVYEQAPIDFKQKNPDDALSFFLAKDNVTELSVSDLQKLPQ